MAEVKKAFNPEFLNRLDEVILFTSLSRRGSVADHQSAGGPNQHQSGRQADQDPRQRRRRQVHPRKDAGGSQLRRSSVAPRAAEVHRGSAVGSAHPRNAASAFRAGSLPGRLRHLLPAHRWRDWRTAGATVGAPSDEQARGSGPRHFAVLCSNLYNRTDESLRSSKGRHQPGWLAPRRTPRPAAWTTRSSDSRPRHIAELSRSDGRHRQLFRRCGEPQY